MFLTYPISCHRNWGKCPRISCHGRDLNVKVVSQCSIEPSFQRRWNILQHFLSSYGNLNFPMGQLRKHVTQNVSDLWEDGFGGTLRDEFNFSIPMVNSFWITCSLLIR